jgi:hypothetical protein
VSAQAACLHLRQARQGRSDKRGREASGRTISTKAVSTGSSFPGSSDPPHPCACELSKIGPDCQWQGKWLRSISDSTGSFSTEISGDRKVDEASPLTPSRRACRWEPAWVACRPTRRAEAGQFTACVARARLRAFSRLSRETNKKASPLLVERDEALTSLGLRTLAQLSGPGSETGGCHRLRGQGGQSQHPRS